MHVGTGTFKGRPAVFVGAGNNERSAASLAIFEAGRVSGMSPAEDPKFRCTNCPSSYPLRFLLFPQAPEFQELGHVPYVRSVMSDGKAFDVDVVEAQPLISRDCCAPAVHYLLDRDLRLERAVPVDVYHSE